MWITKVIVTIVKMVKLVRISVINLKNETSITLKESI